MAYSNFARAQAEVLFRTFNNGKIRMTDAAVHMINGRIEAYINHDVVLDDVEAKLRNAVDALIQNDIAKAQEELDLACKVYGFHFGCRSEMGFPEDADIIFDGQTLVVDGREYTVEYTGVGHDFNVFKKNRKGEKVFVCEVCGNHPMKVIEMVIEEA